MQLNKEFKNIDDVQEYISNFSLEDFKNLGFKKDPKSISDCEDLIYIRDEHEKGRNLHLRINPETGKGALNKLIDKERSENIFTFDLNNPHQVLVLLEHKLYINLHAKDAVDKYKFKIGYDATTKGEDLDIGC